METVGKRIKKMRLEKDWTQKDLAQRLGLKNDTAIANYEAGYSIPKDEIKLKMCEIFNCTLDYLLCKSDVRNPEELKNIPFANYGGLDIDGLEEDELLELQRQIDFIRRMKKKGN